MSFWAGVVQGVKDVDVLKEKEALADERQGVRDQENARYEASIAYRNTRDAKADARLERGDYLSAIGTLNINNLTGVDLGGSGSRTPSTSGGTASGSLNHELARAYELGATNDSLASLLGHNQSAAAVAKTVDLYTTYAAKQEGMPGSAMSYDEYLQQTNVILTPAAEVTIEMVEAAAKRIGVNTEDIYSGNLTYGEMISARLKQTAGSGQLSVTGPNAPKPMDLGEVTSSIAAADQSMVPLLEQTIAELGVKYEGAAADTDEKRILAARLTKAKKDLENFNDGIGTAQFIDEYGANSILSIIANNPDALGRNDFAKYTTAIENRTYNSEAEVLGAYRRNDLLDGDKYVIDNVIFSANGEALESASRGPESSSRPRARPDDLLGTQVGVLPTASNTVPKTDTLFPDFDPTPFTFDTREQANSYIGSLSPEELSKIPYIIIGGKSVKNSSYVSSDEAPAGLGGDEPVVEEVIPVGEDELQGMPSDRIGTVGFQDLGPREDVRRGANESEVLEEGAAKEAERTRLWAEARSRMRPVFMKDGAALGDPVEGTPVVTPQVSFQDLEPEQRERLEAGVKEIFDSYINGTDSEALTKDLVAEFGPEVVKAALAVVTGSSESTDQ